MGNSFGKISNDKNVLQYGFVTKDDKTITLIGELHTYEKIKKDYTDEFIKLIKQVPDRQLLLEFPEDAVVDEKDPNLVGLPKLSLDKESIKIDNIRRNTLLFDFGDVLSQMIRDETKYSEHQNFIADWKKIYLQIIEFLTNDSKEYIKTITSFVDNFIKPDADQQKNISIDMQNLHRDLQKIKALPMRDIFKTEPYVRQLNMAKNINDSSIEDLRSNQEEVTHLDVMFLFMFLFDFEFLYYILYEQQSNIKNLIVVCGVTHLFYIYNMLINFGYQGKIITESKDEFYDFMEKYFPTQNETQDLMRSTFGSSEGITFNHSANYISIFLAVFVLFIIIFIYLLAKGIVYVGTCIAKSCDLF